MLDKLLALLSIACFVGFVGILMAYVKEPDLIIICLAVIAMAIFDFFLLTRGKAKSDNEPPV